MRSCSLCQSSKYELWSLVDGFRLVKCQNCGFVYLLNPAESGQAPESYDDYFQQVPIGEYAADSPDLQLRRLWHINRQRLGWLKSIKPSGRLLDMGCGRGYFLQHARSYGYEVEGIEISAMAAKYAQAQFGLAVRMADLQVPGALDGSKPYDIITLWHVLEHFREPLLILRKLGKCLSPEGILVIEVPNLHSLKFLLSPVGHRWVGGNHPRYHCSFFTARTLAKMLVEAGLSIAEKSPLSYAKDGKKSFRSLVKKMLNLVDMDSFLTVAASSGDWKESRAGARERATARERAGERAREG